TVGNISIYRSGGAAMPLCGGEQRVTISALSGNEAAMKYFPVFADLDGADVLVAGGGEQAAQKLRLLGKTGASVTVVAATVCDEIADLAARGAVRLERRPFRDGDAVGRRLVYAATGERALDAAVSRAAKASAVPVNVVDAPELSTFIT